jgi:hypothetical protein
LAGCVNVRLEALTVIVAEVTCSETGMLMGLSATAAPPGPVAVMVRVPE